VSRRQIWIGWGYKKCRNGGRARVHWDCLAKLDFDEDGLAKWVGSHDLCGILVALGKATRDNRRIVDCIIHYENKHLALLQSYVQVGPILAPCWQPHRVNLIPRPPYRAKH
jgi:hypothetical protein